MKSSDTDKSSDLSETRLSSKTVYQGGFLEVKKDASLFVNFYFANRTFYS